MNTYDPETTPAPTTWLQTDEGERISLVSAFHQRQNIVLANAQLHAVIHVIVENQLALGDLTVLETLARLQKEGLSRHDALHAIGSVLAENLYDVMQEEDAAGESYRAYLERLQKLTARSWRAG